jgi:hypothetical protein
MPLSKVKFIKWSGNLNHNLSFRLIKNIQREIKFLY